MVDGWKTIGSMGNMSGLHWLTGGLGDLVLNVRAGHLGDGVAVLNLDRDQLDLGVVDTVLGGDGSAGVLHCGGHRVGNSVGDRQSNGGMGDKRSSSMGEGVGSERETSKVLSISISFSFTFVDSMGKRSVTDVVNNLLADLLVLNLLSLDGLFGADVLSGGCADLGDEDLLLSHTVGSSHSVVRGGQGTSEELGVSLGFSCRGSQGRGGEQAGQNKDLGIHDDEMNFPR